MTKMWRFTREQTLEEFGAALARFVEDVKRMTDADKKRLSGEVIGDAFVIKFQ